MTSLRIAIRNYSDFENALEEQARLFESLHPGTKVEVVSVGIHELYDQSINMAVCATARFDLALLVTDWLAEGVSNGSLENLNPWQQHIPIHDWPNGWPRSLVQPLIFGEHLSSLPWHDGPECLVYRSDLFADPARRAAFRAKYCRELAPPTTWEEFEQTARFFNDPSAGLYGTVFAAFPMDTTPSTTSHFSYGVAAAN